MECHHDGMRPRAVGEMKVGPLGGVPAVAAGPRPGQDVEDQATARHRRRPPRVGQSAGAGEQAGPEANARVSENSAPTRTGPGPPTLTTVQPSGVALTQPDPATKAQ